MHNVADTPHGAVLPVISKNAMLISMAAFVEGSPFSVKEMRQRCHHFCLITFFPDRLLRYRCRATVI